MGVVLRQIEKQYGSRRLMTAFTAAGAVAFIGAATFDHRALIQGVGIVGGVAVVLTSMNGSLREISPVLQRWSMYAACVASGASVGLALRLFWR